MPSTLWLTLARLPAGVLPPRSTSRMLLTARRQEDIGSDLWTVFNRVQENTIRGGFKGEGQKRQSRELTNIDALSRVNLNLWNAAEEILAAA